MKRKKIIFLFRGLQKAFDRVKYDKGGNEEGWYIKIRKVTDHIFLLEQHASVRWDGEVSRVLKWTERSGCIIPPVLLFHLYREFMIKKVMENVEGIKFQGINIT